MVDKSSNIIESDLNTCWLEEILLCMIGEAFDDYGENVCGAVVQVRGGKIDRLALWTSDMENKGYHENWRNLERKLHLHPGNGMMAYEPHASKVKSTTVVR
ncbi:eukaryotic translation initiation factor 4E [Nephila pilipes]|uniref:Eukaryotic translation initiation factor 4E n=1 Tax=Nephila pilipes TaxID=299642 RepID=A0A8X6NBS9_NEPPI|nr:eukaryotic translation initiation factor 4E [Nephila pilipes]